MKNKIVFLILHYITLEDTKKCVSSILERYPDNRNIEIVIVDNNSNNNSGEDLVKIYKENNRIHIILLDKNLGFANGNNVGFKYAKDKLNADFIIMINNDTYLIQNDFCEIIEEEYKKSNFAVLGPRILMNNNKISDYSDKPESIIELKRKIKHLKLRKILNELHLHYFYDLLVFIKKILSIIFGRKKIQIVDTSIRKENVVLQGCALIFSKEYIKLFDGIDNRTFLFEEEQLLYWRIKNNNLLSVYNPLLMIFHNENSSTNASTNKNMYKKRKLVIENELISKNILLEDLIKKEEKNYVRNKN